MINSGEHNTPEDVWGSPTPEHVSWGSESPKTPWSQQREHHFLVPQNSEDTLKVPLDKVLGIQLQGLYKPSGEDLFFLFIIYYIFIFSYLQWSEVEEQLLTGTLASQIYKILGHDFYSYFEFKILSAHYAYMKQTYVGSDEKILKCGEMNRNFIPK
jgi:hypothetical protein